MRYRRCIVLALPLIAGSVVVGCSSSKTELPSEKKIQKQLKRDAAMREAEDRLEKEKTAGKR